MNKLLCTAALLAVFTASGCTLYFGGDDDHGDDIICADEALPEYSLRNPETGSCDYYGGGGGCYGAPEAQPDWASCPGACEGLDEQTCEATSGCRAAYLEDDYNCPPGADCPISYAFWGCWGTAPTGPIQGVCDGLDAQGCSEHDDCTATYDTVYYPDGTTTTQFAYCQQEYYAPGCYSNADCPAGYECNAATDCYPPPGCDPTTGEACPDVCYGQCVPAQNGCDTVDCGPGSHCELQCYPCDPANPDQMCDYPCDAICVPDYPTCDDGTTCAPGTHCETVCTPPDPTCEGGPMGCPETCSTSCVPDGGDPGTCDGEVMCNIAPPACPDGTTPGISNGCWSGYCIPLTDCNPTNPGSCYEPVACDMAPPACPDGTTPGVANGCYTGYCIPLADCDPQTVTCDQLTTEADCLAQTGCQPVYSGAGCTCYPDGTCSCDSWQFDRCTDGPVIDPPMPL